MSMGATYRVRLLAKLMELSRGDHDCSHFTKCGSCLHRAEKIVELTAQFFAEAASDGVLDLAQKEAP
jgi:hypothetical protein